ncbi:MAG: sugar ABC transporter ATP-binding protein [Christensenellales bacterium]
MISDYLLVMENISKEFPGVRALSNVTFKVRRNSIMGLVGENGAGKSTLMKILSGKYSTYEGTMHWSDKPIIFNSEREALDWGIAIVQQEMNPISEMSIAENIFLGRQIKMKGKIFVDRKDMYDKTVELLKMVDLSYTPDTKMRNLSVAECQMIEIIKAISRNAHMVIMDEPTSAISSNEIIKLFEQIRKLKANGVTIIYISHKLEEIFEMCDEVVVLRDGYVVGADRTENLSYSKIVSMMVGRDMEKMYPLVGKSGTELRLSVRNLSRGRHFKDISFDLKVGEILGFAGMIGAGRSEVMRSIFGLDKPDSGTITLEGKALKISSTTDAIKNGIAMVTEDRAIYGFVGLRSVRDNILLPNTDTFAPRIFIKQEESNLAAENMRKKLNIHTPNISTLVMTLSGGNQQKVVVSKWLLRNVKVLIMDEPTRGIDVGSKYEIYKIITDLSNQGMAIILISSEINEIIGMSHRILVMAEGTICGEIKREEATQEKIMQTILEGGKHIDWSES